MLNKKIFFLTKCSLLLLLLANSCIQKQAVKPIVNKQIENLKSKDHLIRFNSAKILGEIGPEATDAVPSLIQALRDKHAYVRSHAAKALGNIDPDSKEVICGLIRVSEDWHPYVRENATRALSKRIVVGDIIILNHK